MEKKVATPVINTHPHTITQVQQSATNAPKTLFTVALTSMKSGNSCCQDGQGPLFAWKHKPNLDKRSIEQHKKKRNGTVALSMCNTTDMLIVDETCFAQGRMLNAKMYLAVGLVPYRPPGRSTTGVQCHVLLGPASCRAWPGAPKGVDPPLCSSRACIHTAISIHLETGGWPGGRARGGGGEK